uniref:Beta-lactamase class C binding protein-like protein n=1 Tax=Coprinellus disseminatus TaxID=71703 RepID=Q1WMR7_COPDI|nr:beta-lactamase class C binding protein-like protein [Coprinellus disseminatus]
MGGSNFLLLLSSTAIFLSAVYAASTPRNTPATGCPAPLPNLLAHQPIQANAVTPQIRKALDSLDKYLKKRTAAADVESLSIAVVTPAGPIFERGYGVLKANDNTTTQAPDSNSIYRLGSISKMFTALETMLLREKGVLNLDDPVEKYLPDLKPPSASFGWAQSAKAQAQGVASRSSRVTIRQLASHTAGMGRDFPTTKLQKWPSTDAWPVAIPPNNLTIEEPISAINQDPLVGLPYSTPVYSNVGFGLLGAVNIAANLKVNGDDEPKTHKELIQRDIFDVFGLNSSMFRAPTDPPTRARLVVASGQNAIFAESLLGDVQDPAGGQYGTVSDLSKISQAILSPNAPTRDLEYFPDIVREWLRPLYVFPDGTQAVGAPWEISYIPSTSAPLDHSPGLVPIYSKSGDLGPYHNLMSFNQEYGYSIIVLTTGTSNPEEFVQEAFRGLQPALHAAQEDRVKSAYVGKWRIAGSKDIAEVKLIDKQLFLTQLTIGGVNVLNLLNQRRARLPSSNMSTRPVPLWSTGRLDEFRLALGRESLDTHALSACLFYWATLDFGVFANGASIDILYWEDDQLVYPSSGARFTRDLP